MKTENLKNPAAVALGKLAKGKPKTLTEAQRRASGLRLAEARKKRHKLPLISDKVSNIAP